MGWLNASEPYIRAMGVSAIRQLLIADNLLKRELDEKILDGLFIALGDSDSFVHMNAMKAIKEIIMNSKSYGKTTLSTLMDRWCGAIDGNNDEAEGRMCQILLEILGNGAVNIDVDIAHRLLERIVAKISSDSGSDSIILWALLASVLGVSTDLIAQYRPLIHSIIRNIPKALEQQQQQNTEDSLQLQHAIIATLAQLAICLKNAPRLVCSEIDKLNQIISQLLAPQSLLCGESRQRLREILQL
jgi:hypothetical protein